MNTSVLLFLNIGGPETMLIMLAVLLLFGGKKLPELARGLGKGMREFKDATDDVKKEIHRNINAVQDEVNTTIDTVKEESAAIADETNLNSAVTDQTHLNSN